MFFILCDNKKTLFSHKSLSLLWALFNHHIVAFFETSVLKEVCSLRYLRNHSAVLIPKFQINFNLFYDYSPYPNRNSTSSRAPCGKSVVTIINYLIWLTLGQKFPWLLHCFPYFSTFPGWHHWFLIFIQNFGNYGVITLIIRSIYWQPISGQ